MFLVGAGGLGSLRSPCLLRKQIRLYVPFARYLAKDGLLGSNPPLTSKKEHSQGKSLNCVLGGSGWTRLRFASPCLLRKQIRLYVPFADAKDGLLGSNPPLQSKKEKSRDKSLNSFLGGSGWIRTTEVVDNRFTVCPLWPLGNTPIYIKLPSKPDI